MATIKTTLTTGISGAVSDHVTTQLFEVTIPDVTDAQLESGASVLHIPGENPQTATLADIKEGKSFLFESIDAELKVVLVG